jgi:hypothetical protein
VPRSQQVRSGLVAGRQLAVVNLAATLLLCRALPAMVRRGSGSDAAAPIAGEEMNVSGGLAMY